MPEQVHPSELQTYAVQARLLCVAALALASAGLSFPDLAQAQQAGVSAHRYLHVIERRHPAPVEVSAETALSPFEIGILAGCAAILAHLSRSSLWRPKRPAAAI